VTSARPRLELRAVLALVRAEVRSARARLFFFALCLAVGVAAVVGVAALVGAFEAGLREQSRSLLAADLRVSARRALPSELDALLAGEPHRRADVLELAAMLSSGDQSRLVELKVAGAGYPFHGALVFEPQGLVLADLGDDGLAVAPELREALGLELGERVELGGAAFVVRAFLLDEPDRLEFQMTLGPRVLATAAGHARTNLGDAYSRVKYSALFAFEGDATAERLTGLVERLRAELPDSGYVNFQTHGDAQPSVARSAQQVEHYLGLVALLSLLLGGVGVAQIVRAWVAERTQGVAVLRCLGLAAREIALVHLTAIGVLAATGCALGALAGAALPFLVQQLAPDVLGGSASSLFQPLAILRGLALGLGVALLFSLIPLSALWRVAPVVVLRADAVPLAPPRAVRVGAPLALFVGVVVAASVQAGSVAIGAAFAVGVALLAALLFGGARGLELLARRLPRGRTPLVFEHGLSAVARPGSGTTGAVTALGLGVMVVVAMWYVQDELGRALREALPADAPSVFLVDVQPEQWDGVRGELEAGGARTVDSSPVVMARLARIDGRPVAELARAAEDEGRATWFFTREQRLTWRDSLPESNRLVTGSLWSDPRPNEVSVEVEYAADLGVDVGSTIALDVQGVPIELVVTSLREVDWESFSINFFLLVEPGALDGAPHFRIASARVEPPEAEFALQSNVARLAPNVTVLRVRPLLAKLAAVLDRIALGVRALGAFTVATGLVILAGAIGTSALRRAREAALLKALGLTRAGVARLFAVEYALLGLLAGAIGAAGALVLGFVFLTELAELEVGLPLVALPAAALGTAVLAVASGLLASRRALRASPAATLGGRA
jgi:putative ABC transport system permease protein